MKKRILTIIAAIVVPCILAYILARLMTPTPEALFMKKMKYYFNTEDFYTEQEYQASGEFFKVKQAKVKDNYYLVLKDDSNEEIFLNLEGSNVYYGFSDKVVSVPKSQFEDNKSLFLIDKISLKDINAKSIALDKDKKGLYYTFSMNDGRNFAVLFEKGKLVELKAFDIEYLPHVSPQAADTMSGEITVKYSQWETPSDMSKVVKLSNTAQIYSLDELASSDGDLNELKRIVGLLDEYDEDSDDEDDGGYEEDDDNWQNQSDGNNGNPDFEVLDF